MSRDSSITAEKYTDSSKQPTVEAHEKKAPALDLEEDSPNVAVYEVDGDKADHDIFDSGDDKGMRRMNWKEGAVVAAKSQVGSEDIHLLSITLIEPSVLTIFSSVLQLVFWVFRQHLVYWVSCPV